MLHNVNQRPLMADKIVARAPAIEDGHRRSGKAVAQVRTRVVVARAQRR